MEIRDKLGIEHRHHQLHKDISNSWQPQPTEQEKIVVGFDYQRNEMLHKLIGGKPTLQIIPIVGNRGIGKTTLARGIYYDPHIESHFEVRSWVTMSREYDVQKILLQILENHGIWEISSQMGERELGAQLYKSLFDKRYLIIMDNMWSTEPWEKIKCYLPDNSNGSRIIVTTRSSKVAWDLSGTRGLLMDLLPADYTWELFSRTVFGRKEHCPPELQNIGMRIAKQCFGLPLAITIIGGLLARSNRTQDQWWYILQELMSIMNSEEDSPEVKIIRLSYSLLPIHLKPCFLHLGIFPEDREIHVSDLLKMWVAEGFLKPISGRSLEEVAEEYLKDLIQRNFVLVRKRGISGERKSCAINDVYRDLCRTEVQREKFVCITSQHGLDDPNDEGIEKQRRIVIEGTLTKVDNFSELSPQFTSQARALICNSDEMLPSYRFRLLRLLKADHTRYRPVPDDSLDDLFQLVNSRHLHITTGWNNPEVITGWCDGGKRSFPSSLCRLWNLQTLTIKGWYGHVVVAPPEIWNMSSLRHVNVEELYLLDPQDGFILENLQTLMKVMNFKFSEEVVKRIPNVKKLKLSYMDIDDEPEPEVASQYCLNNLGRLDKLESLGCAFTFKRPSRKDLVQNITFPNSLKKLTLYGTGLHWEDMNTMIGSLPNLEELKLKYRSFIGAKWQLLEGGFVSLKYLLISFCNDLKHWTAEGYPFPRLERLVLENLLKLREIPPGIGHIPTLQSIQLESCSASAMLSAKQIAEEQLSSGNEGFIVRVLSVKKDRLLQSLEGDNFVVITNRDVKYE